MSVEETYNDSPWEVSYLDSSLGTLICNLPDKKIEVNKQAE
jgi:hypothetical protein